ncbi:MAG: Tab2 family RNA-binding protein [cyanobacterium endosymbiont of Rhopalodia musculus]|uniref:Tab2/Atab2 family RNA-binding protein n=1 Tax=cyanobacterium endosymbiont of Epithemia clementina EcSB TaxID=3034674 RepID=UPI0024810759|nr:Tab2/Atab2 family RNA-binding protein [cyanobacterium endosymbiont of Epithemia clementina EcSB]WGT66764.1 Tab2/Atab2 family RNA-binding protein [cyanobacterium endosymbiont of Epithemia clementina EcSB]
MTLKTWQADFCKTSFQNQEHQSKWQLLICDAQGKIIYQAICEQKEANLSWLFSQLESAIEQEIPDIIQVFRPQLVNLLISAANKFSIKVQATRRTPKLKEILKKQGINNNFNPVKLEQPPPQKLAKNLWGERWQFVTFPGVSLIEFFSDRPIPIVDIPDLLLPISLGLASTARIPGIIIYGGRTSMYLARWLVDVKPVALNYIPTQIDKSGGLVLESDLVDRWILATFEDSDMAKAAQQYELRKNDSQGLHFLVVQPDDSAMTYSGFWLLRHEEI